MPVLPALATLAVTLWGIGCASFWRDEAATLSATRRSLPEMVRMLGHVDAVHGAYYLLMWPLAHLFGTSETVMRLPSAIAMAAAAFGTAAIGRRLGPWQTGLLAGLVFSLLPMTSRFGQEARSYALVTAVAVLASYLLTRAMEEPGRCWAVGYGLSLGALGFLNMFGLLIVPAHAVTLAMARRHASRDICGQPDVDAAPRSAREHVSPASCTTPEDISPAPRTAPEAVSPTPRTTRDAAVGTVGGWVVGTARGWVIAAAAACVAIIPVALLGWHERQQLAWLRRPTTADVLALLTQLTASWMSLGLVTALGVTGAACSGARGRPGSTACGGLRQRQAPAGLRLYWLSVPWFLLPPVLLIAVSQIRPVYVDRYVVFCLPALALLAGAGLAAVGRYWRIAAVSTLALLALHMQQAIRQPSGHGDGIRAAARLLLAQAKAGDAVVYFKPGFRDVGAVYAYGFRRLRDIGLKQSAIAAGNLSGTEVPPAVLQRRLQVVERVWLVEVDRDLPDPAVIGWPPFRLIQVWSQDDITLRLYGRSGSHAGHHEAA